MRKLMIALAMGIGCLTPLVGHTLGLGDIEVNSALNQELDARIKLIDAVPEDTQDLIVKLGTAAEFNQAGIDRPYLLQSLKFSTTVIDGTPYIKVTSTKPIREPYLDFLVEIDWPKGQLLREYTILLNPPVFNTTASDVRPAVAAQQNTGTSASSAEETGNVPPPSMGPDVGAGSVSAASGSTATAAPPAQSTSSQPATTATKTSRVLAMPPAPNMTLSTNNTTTTAASNNSDFRVKNGDTAWSLANELRPDQSITTQQMLVALLRSNPDSFIKGNVNGLKRGYILRIPDRSEITKISQAEAVALVNKQNALWQQYQQTVSGGSSAPAKTGAASAGKTGKTQTAGSGSTSKNGAHLTIVSAGKGAGAGTSSNVDASKMTPAQLRAQLALTQEQLVSANLEKNDLKGQVGDLKKQVDKMKRLLNIENKGMANVESTATGGENAAKTAATENKTQPEKTTKSASEKSTTVAAATTKPETAEKPTESASKTPSTAEKEKVFVDNKTKPQAAGKPQQAATPVNKKPQPPMMPPVRHQPRSFLSTLLNNPMLLGAMGAAVLLLAALVYMLVKRRRGSGEDQDEVSAGTSDDDLASVADMLDDQAVNEEVSDDEVETTMAAAEDEAEKFDSDATMVIPPTDDTVITQAGEPEEEEARDDVIAEADVYLAYGIYQQAEELLQNAIKEHPDNDGYRMKLAETYFAGKNTSGFAELAAEIHERTNGTGNRWQKVVAMGKELIPDNALFKGESADDVALDDIVPSPEPMDIDLGLDDTSGGNAEPDLDLGLGGDAGELELPEETASDAAPLEELEFDLSETEATSTTEEDFSLDFDATTDLDAKTDEDAGAATPDSGLDFDLDLSGESEATAEVEEEDAVAADDDEEFDIDISEELEATATIVTTSDELASDNGSSESSETEAPDIDLSADELTSETEESDFDLSELDDVDEVSTKLDLARAYLDMGDNEGTRSILEEVIADGNAEQKAEAEKLLAEING